MPGRANGSIDEFKLRSVGTARDLDLQRRSRRIRVLSGQRILHLGRGISTRHVYRNVGNWQFQDVTSSSGAGPSAHYSHGVAVADFDEDGFPDILVTGYGGVTLYRNQGDGFFSDTTEAAKLSDQLWSTSAAWGDFNGDAILDVYIAHYVSWSINNNVLCTGSPGHPRDVCPPQTFDPLPDTIYFGNGNGSFRNATVDAGLRGDGKGLGVVAADSDLDGDLDIYVANDTVENVLYVNNGRGRLDDASLFSGTAVSDRGYSDGSMGTDVADYDADGQPDIWVTNYEREDFALYRNQGKGLFRHVSRSVGIASLRAAYVGWGTRFLDADLDGDEDLVVSNGHAIRFPTESPRLQRPLLLENRNGSRLVDVSDHAGDYMTSSHAGRGLATGDLDGDGDEDVVISNLNEPVAVLSNESNSGNHWLAVRLIGRRSCRSSIGAVAVAGIGGRSQTKQVRGGSSYASTSDPTLHFGCGTSSTIDTLTVTWIGGRTVTLRNLECDRVLTVIEPDVSSP